MLELYALASTDHPYHLRIIAPADFPAPICQRHQMAKGANIYMGTPVGSPEPATYLLTQDEFSFWYQHGAIPPTTKLVPGVDFTEAALSPTLTYALVDMDTPAVV